MGLVLVVPDYRKCHNILVWGEIVFMRFTRDVTDSYRHCLAWNDINWFTFDL